MTVSIRRMRLGDGYRYLIESVARGDGAADMSSPLTRYYAESGTPPGRFLGAGLAGANGGSGIAEGTECTEDMLFRMLGQCTDPVSGARLGRVAKAGSVAGFDLTFSVPKSISAAWAVADAGTQSVIYQAHRDAIRIALAYAEQHTFFSRSGVNGVLQEQIRGVLAVGFDHWDSRAGDPQLHTHVVVANRAQSLDGTWRTLDSRCLFKQIVTLSELHQGILQDLLTVRLGWGWDARRRRHSAVPKWETVGVADALMAEFSQRSSQIDQAKDAAVERFVATRGRQPTNVEIVRLRQHATLRTRPDKHHCALAEQTERWRERARGFVGEDTVAWVSSLRDRNDLPLLRPDDLHDGILTDLAAVSGWAVCGKRATFTRANILAEVHRQLHGVRFASPQDRIVVGERAADLALGGSVLLTAPELHHVPGRFRRPDGTSKFRGSGAAVYTSSVLLEAEARLLDAGRSEGGPRVDAGVVATVAEANLPGRDYGMSIDQAVAVESIATSGRVLDVLVGPAGTGKSTSMAGLRTIWEQRHGPGSVIGLAPSAAAAEVLGTELGIDTENTAKWLTETSRQPARLAEIADLEQRLAHLGPTRHTTAARLAARRQLTARLDTVRAEHARWQVKPGQLVIVDEASLAGTFALDELLSQARDARAKVLLVGDWAQLSAIQAGGAFAMLVADRDIAPELSDVRRFTHPWEKAASVRLRVGDEQVIDTYRAHDRIESGTRADMLAALYEQWKHDTDAGLTSLMIAADLDTVSDLNHRARTELVAAGRVTEHGLPVAGSGTAGVGDRVVTRLNNRLLSTGTRWVKNGDQWVVTAAHSDGSMSVQRAVGGGEVVLPADYVREHVELGYASTAHRAQGRTVDTAHAMISTTTTREALYVAATRGRAANRLYIDTFHNPDPDTSHGPIPELTAAQVFAAVLATPAADVAAHTVMRREQDTAESISGIVREYLTIARDAQAHRWDALISRSGLTREQYTDTIESDAYGPLLAALRTAESRGRDVESVFPQLVQSRPIDTAVDIAAVLHGRVDRWIAASQPGRTVRDRAVVGLIARADGVIDPDLRRALDERVAAMERRATVLVDRALTEHQPWIEALGPPPTQPSRFAAWASEARTVAAFRELHSIRDDIPAAVPQAGSAMGIGEARAAIAAWQRARAIAEQADCHTPAAAWTTADNARIGQIGVQP